MLKNKEQLGMSFSKFQEIYDILIPDNNKWRRMKNEIDFSFVYDIVKNSYSDKMGRTAKDVEFMFKLLLLKTESGLSDIGLINMVKVNMEYKYFLGLDPEDVEMIDPSLLTKFRRNRLAKYEKDENGKLVKVQDDSQKLMNALISKTVDLAKEKVIMKKRNVGIVDSTHSLSMYGHITPRQKLINVSKNLRKNIYRLDETMKKMMPRKREASGILEDEIKYCNELLDVINKDGRFLDVPQIEENINLLKEVIEDTEIELEYSKDQDAKIGHKTADTAFFGYKTHIMMSEERIITAATVTTGEKTDGKQLQGLIKETMNNGIKLEAVIGDGAYSHEENIKFCKDINIKNVSKLSESAIHGKRRKEDELEFNKDAGMYICKAGHMAYRKQYTKSHNNKAITYFFDINKCKHCPLKDGCYKEGSTRKSYTVMIKSDIHNEQKEYMETKEFKEYYGERYKIEAKNGEIKKAYNYDKAWACGQSGMTIQGATTLFLTNMKRIYKLEDEKKKNIANKS